jgi:hypothetical protein
MRRNTSREGGTVVPYDDPEYRKTYQGMNRGTAPSVVGWGEPVAAADVGKALRELNDAMNLRQCTEELRQRLKETDRLDDYEWTALLNQGVPIHINIKAKVQDF